MKNFFSVNVIPDIVDGDVSNVIKSDKSHLDIGANEILFDWTAVDVPKGANKLVSISATVNFEDGAVHASHNSDIILIFARSFNGVAPTTLGAVNTAPDGCFNIRSHFLGGYTLKGSDLAQIDALNSQSWQWFYISGGALSYGGDDEVIKYYSMGLPMILDLESQSGTNVGYDTLYVAGIQVSARHYATGVLVDGAITSDTEDTIAVTGVAATKIFSVGDTVYLHDVDTALGTIKSLTDTSIVLNAAIADGTNLDDTDELINANPIRMIFGFER